MEDILSALEASTSRLYSEKKFKEVEEMYSTFIKESQEQSRFVQIVPNPLYTIPQCTMIPTHNSTSSILMHYKEKQFKVGIIIRC